VYPHDHAARLSSEAAVRMQWAIELPTPCTVCSSGPGDSWFAYRSATRAARACRNPALGFVSARRRPAHNSGAECGGRARRLCWLQRCGGRVDPPALRHHHRGCLPKTTPTRRPCGGIATPVGAARAWPANTIIGDELPMAPGHVGLSVGTSGWPTGGRDPRRWRCLSLGTGLRARTRKRSSRRVRHFDATTERIFRLTPAGAAGVE